MFKTHGVGYLPLNTEVKVQPFGGKGSYFNFSLVAPDTDSKGSQIRHIYEASMFVPTDEVNKWKEALVPGTTLEVENAWWDSKENPKGTPWAKMKLSRTSIRILPQHTVA